MSVTPFNRPSLVGNEIKYLHEAIARGQLSGDGQFTKLCNSQIAKMAGARAALLTHSCTAALEMVAILCNLGPGDEVIMPSFTFVSTANAVALRGAVPVFVDIDPATLNIDPVEVAKAVTKNTRAIIAVHYAGFPADMDSLAEICLVHDLILIEDAAQALGSSYKGRQAGGLADLGAFSFHETKNIISGEGGALTVNRQEFVARAEIIREKGTNRSGFLRGQTDKYTWVDLGSSFLPGELIASFLHAQLEMVETINVRRVAMYDRYMEAFATLESSGRLRRPVCPKDCTGNGHMFYLLLRSMEDRNEFIDYMRQHEIITPFHYVPLHSSPAGLRFGRSRGSLTVTEQTAANLVRLPMFFDLKSDIEKVIHVALDYFNQSKGRSL